MEQNLILKLEDVQAGQAANDRFQHLTLGLGRAEILAVMSSRAYDLNNLIELLNGTLEASAGRLFLYGREYPLKELKNFHIVFAIRRNTLFDHFTIAQNMFIRGDCSKKKAEQLAKKQLEEFELDIDLNKNIAELTSGEQKVIEILRAYNCAPDIVVLYDAMNYVEKRFAPRMRSIFEKFREKGKSIIYLTTNLEDALMFSDRICLLGAGKVEAEYSTADIRKNPRELIYLMSGLESGHWDDSEEKLVLESIIETRDTLTSSYELKDTLGALAANISRVLNASSCIIYINDTTNLSMLDSVSSDDELAKNARLVPGCLHEFDGGMRVVRAADAPGEFPRYFVYDPPCHTFLVAPVTIKGQRMGYVQVSYQGAFSLTEEEKLYLSAFTREVALAIETSRLLGRSVLLQESHHRIKNNLQEMCIRDRRTSRLSSVIIWMVSKMSLVFSMRALPPYTWCMASYSSCRVQRTSTPSSLPTASSCAEKAVKSTVACEMSTSMIMAKVPRRMRWVTSSTLTLAAAQAVHTLARMPTASWPMTVITASILPLLLVL